jgi:hypothetical protein
MIGGEYNFDSIIGQQAVGDGVEHNVIHGRRSGKYHLFLFFFHLLVSPCLPSGFWPHIPSARQ